MSLEHLDAIRRHESRLVLDHLARMDLREIRILEIGAGTGRQAQALSAAGHVVSAIDLAESSYSAHRVFPVQDYDGRVIPFPDASFDLIYSSNVLEHVPDLPNLLRECRRVLRPGGHALHLVPNASWRLLTDLTQVPVLAGNLMRGVSRRLRRFAGYHPVGTVTSSVTTTAIAPGSPRGLARWAKLFCPERHGETGNWVSETWYFSRWSWNQRFRSSGWRIDQRGDNGLCYSGSNLLGWWVPMSTRSLLGRMCGGNCHVYVVRPVEEQQTS